MATLKLCFQPEETSAEHIPLTSYDVNELTLAANGIAAIIRVMAEYTNNNQYEEENVGPVFNVLEWLIEPISDYLNEYPYPASWYSDKSEHEGAGA
jgi:hypothetical protein